MDQNFIKYINESFKKLVETYGFRIKTELNKEQSYMIEYGSEDFVIKIEKYFREFYASVYRVNELDNGVNLFNLLGYLKQEDVKVPKSEYFRKEIDIDECYRKQLNHISTAIYENYPLIHDFFNDDKYELNMAKLEKYWKKIHPELYE